MLHSLTGAHKGQMKNGGRTLAKALYKRASAYDTRLGERISLLRRARGLSLAELARRLGLTPQQLQKYERGTNRVTAARLYEIALSLDVRIQYFFEDMGETSVTAANATDQRVSAEDFLWVLARLKDEKTRWRVLKLISALVSDEE